MPLARVWTTAERKRLVAGVVVATIVTYDRAMELQLTMPRTYHRTATMRFLFILLWNALVSLLTSSLLYSCLATEFSSRRLLWYDIVTEQGKRRVKPLRVDIYVWPMVIDYRHGTEKRLVRIPFRSQDHE